MPTGTKGNLVGYVPSSVGTTHPSEDPAKGVSSKGGTVKGPKQK